MHSTLIKGLSEEVAITLRPRVWGNVGLLLACSVFVAIGVWMGQRGEWMGYLCAAFFGLGIPIAILQFVPGASYLLVERDGFTTCSLFRKGRFLWTDVDEFFVVKMKKTGLTVKSMVGFNFSPSYNRSRIGRAVASAMAGCEGALPDTYGHKAEELADYLNYRLAQSRARAAAAQ